MSDAKALEAFNSKKVVGNILSLTTGEIGARVIAFIGITFIARTLGPEGFGIIGFALALFGYIALAVSGGFDEVGAREVARRPHEASSIAISVILVRTALAFVALLAIVVAAWSLNKPATVKTVLLLMGLLLFSLAFDTSWVYKGLERSRRVGAALILGQTLNLLIVLLIIKAPKDVVFVPLAQFSGELAAAMLLIVPILRLGKIRLNFYEGIKLLCRSGIRTLSRLFRTLIFTFDIVLIGFMLGERQVGLYTAPYRICFLLLAVASAVHISYLPALTRAYAQGVGPVEHLIARSVSLSAAIAAPIVIGGMIVAPTLLRSLFGASYVEGAEAFRLLLLSIGFIFINGTIRNILLVSDRLKMDMVIMAAAAVLNIIMNLLLIPRYGLTGAALATALAEALVLILGAIVIFKSDIRPQFQAALRPLLAAGIMGVALSILKPNQVLAWYLLIGLITYVAALIILRGVPPDAQPYMRNFISFAGTLRAAIKS